jgi:hypothetical protein
MDYSSQGSHHVSSPEEATSKFINLNKNETAPKVMRIMTQPLRKKLLALGGCVKQKHRLRSQKFSKKILDR